MKDYFNVTERIMKVYDGMKSDGTVVLPAFDDAAEGKERYLSCKMVWTKDDAVSLCGEITDLIGHFRNLSGRFDELNEMDEEVLKTVLPKEELEVWFTYRPFYLYDLYYDQVQEILAKEEMINEARELMQKQASGEELDEDERFIVNVYGHEYLDDYEWNQLEKYRNIYETESELRVGKGAFARYVVEGGTRIIKSMAMKAPAPVMENVITFFINAVILHRFCEECIPVDVEAVFRKERCR